MEARGNRFITPSIPHQVRWGTEAVMQGWMEGEGMRPVDASAINASLGSIGRPSDPTSAAYVAGNQPLCGSPSLRPAP